MFVVDGDDQMAVVLDHRRGVSKSLRHVAGVMENAPAVNDIETTDVLLLSNELVVKNRDELDFRKRLGWETSVRLCNGLSANWIDIYSKGFSSRFPSEEEGQPLSETDIEESGVAQFDSLSQGTECFARGSDLMLVDRACRIGQPVRAK